MVFLIMKLFCFTLIIMLTLLFACRQADVSAPEIDQTVIEPDQDMGIKMSEWYESEKHGRKVLDILNFDIGERRVNVTTLCYGEDSVLLSENDSAVLKIPGKHQWTWVPVCPAGTVTYNVRLDRLS